MLGWIAARCPVVLGKKIFKGNELSIFIHELVLERDKLLGELIKEANLENNIMKILWRIESDVPVELRDSRQTRSLYIELIVVAIKRLQGAIAVLLPSPEEMPAATNRLLTGLHMGTLPQGWDRSSSWEEISRAVTQKNGIEREQVEERHDLGRPSRPQEMTVEYLPRARHTAVEFGASNEEESEPRMRAVLGVPASESTPNIEEDHVAEGTNSNLDSAE